ncbi:hypothetical protein NP233_g9845 [Leucocoprinus birnbaumii]|uniref:Autophagy-related protein 2 n=1 Tax=Leucocoprinus birnbaumii TaxID=56174 RepID=A0AAD5VK32_9AGAR|nr:hypothetical protein NP233_g9845 [Leucocoprinus birnbaumii]
MSSFPTTPRPSHNPGLSQLPSHAESKGALRHVSIRQVHRAAHVETHFEIDGREVEFVALFANVYDTTYRGTRLEYGLDDGSGRIRAFRWLTDDEVGKREVDEYNAKVVGRISEYRGIHSISLIKVNRALNGPHEIFHHMAQSMVERLMYQYGPPNRAVVESAMHAARMNYPLPEEVATQPLRNVGPTQPGPADQTSALPGPPPRTPSPQLPHTPPRTLASAPRSQPQQVTLDTFFGTSHPNTFPRRRNVDRNPRGLSFSAQNNSPASPTPQERTRRRRRSPDRPTAGPSTRTRNQASEFVSPAASPPSSPIRDRSALGSGRDDMRMILPSREVTEADTMSEPTMARTNATYPRDPYSHLTNLQRDIILTIQNTLSASEDEARGVSITVLAKSIAKRCPGFDVSGFNDALEYLYEEGYIYNTFDETHVACHTYLKKTPDCTNPMCVEFPGICWTEEGKPNWVGCGQCFVIKCPRYNPTESTQSQEYQDDPLLIYNYAKAGDKVDGVSKQIVHLSGVGQKSKWARPPWKADNTLFVTWVGINDCSTPTIDIPTQVEKLIEFQGRLYGVGARNFLLIGILPLDRSPAGEMPSVGDFFRSRVNEWNHSLERRGLDKFGKALEDATVFLFHPEATFNRLLDNPTLYGFDAEGAAIWLDSIRPTSLVHDYLAGDLATFVSDIKPNQQPMEADAADEHMGKSTYGDSYTDIRYQGEVPSTDNPLGVTYPGVPWTENGKPNWIGHLITKYCPHPRYDPDEEEQREDYRNHPLLVYNYARGGDRVTGVATQIRRLFLPKVGQKPTWAPWDANSTLFLTWVGINDCASSMNNSDNIQELFELQEELYSAGARNFLFIDVPPVHKGAMALFLPSTIHYGGSRENWNELLQQAMEEFMTAHDDRTLGHFLKPGQLDVGQIDSQIGSGFVQVKDLELDNGAINDILSGLPLTLTSGTLSSATVRIPWPNPLTSTVGFSVHSLHLTFEIVPLTSNLSPPDTNLSSSVASMADSFLHEELTPREEATLLDSFHSEFPGAFASVEQDIVPGGLDPFDVSGGEEHRAEGEPGGISLFATLIERLLSRFEFDAHDIQITLVHPDNAAVTLSLSETRYNANTKQTEPASTAVEHIVAVIRSLTFKGVELKMKNLQGRAVYTQDPLISNLPTPYVNPDISHIPGRPSSPSSSSSSSLDEDTTLAMSQSLANLPPRPPSPYSVASSMYQSALSAVEEADEMSSQSTVPPPSPPTRLDSSHIPPYQEEMVFSSGSTPIIIQAVTTPPSQSVGLGRSQQDRMSFSLQTGIFTCVLRPWHIRNLLCISGVLSSGTSKPRPQASKTKVPIEGLAPFDVEGSVNLRGLVLVLLPSQSDASSNDGIQQFFLHPLVPPSLPSGYVRLHIEGISTSFNIPSRPLNSRKQNVPSGTSATLSSQLTATFSIHNFNAFVFHPSHNDDVLAFPILFTDQYLPTQYASHHLHPSELDRTLDQSLPDLDLLDWTNPSHQRKGGARLSYWRCKPKGRQQTGRPASGAPLEYASSKATEKQLDIDPDERAVTVEIHKLVNRQGSSQLVLEGKVTPLHLFVDLESVVGDDTVMTFLEEATKGIQTSRDTASLSADNPDLHDDTPPASPRPQKNSDKDKERRRLERLVLDDLDLGYDNTPQETTRQASSKQEESDIRLTLKFTAIRVELRVPSPGNTRRSGALVIDVHNLELKNDSDYAEHPHHPRFAESTHEAPSTKQADSRPILNTKCDRIVVAHSLVGRPFARALLSVGPLGQADETELLDEPAPLRPRLSVIQSFASSGMITALSIELPSAHVVLSKELVDGLQYFIDDASQLLEQFAQRTAKAASVVPDGGDTSLIGSHFFSKSRSNSSSALMSSTSTGHSETVVQISISETFLRAWVPRTDTEETTTRPFDIFASELNVLVELKPEGKEETVVTLGLLDAKVVNVFKNGKPESLLQLTSPRSLTSTPRPLVKLRFVSIMTPGTTTKETRIKLTLSDFTCNILPDIDWVKDLEIFTKAPPGTFETVIPTERTYIALKIMDGSVRAYAPTKPGAVVVYVGDADLSTEISGNSLESAVALEVQYASLLSIDDIGSNEGEHSGLYESKGVSYWKSFGFALIAEVAETNTVVTVTKSLPVHIDLNVDGIQLHLHLAADTLNSLSALINDILSTFKTEEEDIPQDLREPTILSEMSASRNLMSSVEDIAFKRPPEIGPAPDMIHDDLPTNPEYLDESFGAAAGLREFDDDELDDLEDDVDDDVQPKQNEFAEVEPGATFSHNGEIIKVHSEGINMIEEYYDNLPPVLSESPVGDIETKLQIRVRGGDATLFLYDGYDWARTRRTIEEGVKEMRRRLAKIRQLVANGQVQESDMAEANAVLFNSVYIGIDQDVDMTEPDALIAAIDEELKEDVETATQSSWQSLRPTGAPSSGGKPRSRVPKVHGKKLTRSRGPSMEFKLMGLNADIDQFYPDEILVSKTFVTIRDIEILDHIKTSTWKKFLTSMRSDTRGNIRETDSDMVRIELRGVRPAPGHPAEEARLRAKILPLRLYVDQDAVDFLKKFFSFKDPHEVPAQTVKPAPEAYIQLAEIFPVDLKLDYKPRRVDYRALREGRTIELMNFFHFDGAEMTLRHITLAGVTGWPRLFEMLNDLWTPDVKATQLVDVISGVSPIRSMVNVGSGVADLVLLPISQYKKDGRIVRGMQKGATAFVKSTAIEAIKMGARLATGTQVILEQAENVLGVQFSDSYMTESLQVPSFDDAGHLVHDLDDDDESDLISKYAEQPTDIREGVQFAYQSLRRNLNSAAQTILAIPMEVYERSGERGTCPLRRASCSYSCVEADDWSK